MLNLRYNIQYYLSAELLFLSLFSLYSFLLQSTSYSRLCTVDAFFFSLLFCDFFTKNSRLIFCTQFFCGKECFDFVTHGETIWLQCVWFFYLIFSSLINWWQNKTYTWSHWKIVAIQYEPIPNTEIRCLSDFLDICILPIRFTTTRRWQKSNKKRNSHSMSFDHAIYNSKRW